MYEDKFAERLAQLRIEKGVSAREMSLALGQNPNYINHIENKQMLPSMLAFFYICEYLQITPEDFFSFDISVPTWHQEIVANLRKLNREELKSLNTIIKSMVT
ncbi:MAG: helix-turn-helix transcriptional regulator [Eubacteriales bacterium]|nr:helix-turn-helix transcriptional regulator [Eubacteriales bacterium]